MLICERQDLKYTLEVLSVEKDYREAREKEPESGHRRIGKDKD